MSAGALPVITAWLNVPTAWLFVGSGLGLATILLVSLLRTRWRYVKAWKKCALLSLWVHVLLAYAATVVQIASGGIGPGEGYGPPIQVALLSTEITPLNEVSVAEPVDPTTQTAQAEIEQPEAAGDDPEIADPEIAEAKPQAESTPLEAPELLPEPEPVIAEPLEAEPTTEPADEPPSEALAIEEPDEAPAVEQHSAPKTEKPKVAAYGSAPPKALEAASGDAAKPQAAGRSRLSEAPVPDAYADRFATNRAQLVAGGGGNADTERAVRAALTWLAAAQSDDGHWNAKRHGAGQERYTLDQDRGGAGAKADAGVGGLALLAFLGAGHSHREGPYSVEVARGLDYLRRTQKTNGNLSGDAELFAQTYCHSMASFAVGEAFALTKDDRLEPIVRAAANYSLALQHPTDGGWRYRPGDTGDTSQLGWQVMSLKSAQLAGLDIPDATWTKVDRFLRRVERGQAGGLAVYRPEEALPSRPMTAEALYCRQLTTGRPDGELSPAALDEAVNSLAKEPPSTREINLYYWYYATLALHRAQHASPQAAAAWQRWNDALTRTLLATQQQDGSWPTTCIWGGYGGRVYTTSLAAMCLEVYYRYAPGELSNDDASDIAQRKAGAWK